MSSENTDLQEDLQEDFLEVDSKIPGQNYCCLSFVSPEKLIKNKDLFKTRQFMQYIMGEKLENEDEERVRQTFIEKTKESLSNDNNFTKVYDTWLFSREKDIEEKFNESVDFQTSMRGIKVRGTYDTLKEAQIRAKVLQRRDKNFNVFVGQVGYWLPWDPSTEDINEQEYQEDQLNQLMKKYNENADEKEEFYEQEKQEKIRKAREENRKKNKTDRSEFELNKKEDKNKIEKMRTIVDSSRGYTTKKDEVQKVTDQFTTLTDEDPWLQRQKSTTGEGEKKVMSIE